MKMVQTLLTIHQIKFIVKFVNHVQNRLKDVRRTTGKISKNASVTDLLDENSPTGNLIYRRDFNKFPSRNPQLRARIRYDWITPGSQGCGPAGKMEKK